ncbi:hypothetical protein HDV06_002510 [Boothiomyces sp. JEL0866]|nr:hypothetical protein HDV06_002510 [Boothiomyces sp. JEL0866]
MANRFYSNSVLAVMQNRLQNTNENLKKYVDDVVLGFDTRRIAKNDAFDLLLPLLSRGDVPGNLYNSMLYLDKQKSLETKNEQLYLHYISSNNYIQPFSYNTFNYMLLRAIQNQDKRKIIDLLRIKKWRLDKEIFPHLEALFDHGYKKNELVCFLLMENHVDDAFEYFLKVNKKITNSDSELQEDVGKDRLENRIQQEELITNQNLISKLLFVLSSKRKTREALTLLREILPQIRYPKALMVPLKQTSLSIEPDSFLQKNIVYTLEKAKLPKIVESLGYSFPKRNVAQYNSALVDSLKRNDHAKAKAVLDELLYNNIKIDVKMYCTILSFRLEYGSLKDGKSVYQHILLNELTPDIKFFNVWLEREIIDSVIENSPHENIADIRNLKRNIHELSGNAFKLLQRKQEQIFKMIKNFTEPNSKTYSLLLYTNQEHLIQQESICRVEDYDYYTNVIPALLEIDYSRAKSEFLAGIEQDRLNRFVTNSMLTHTRDIHELSFLLYTLYKKKYTFPKPLLANILEKLIDNGILWCIVLIPRIDYWRDGNRLFSKVVYDIPTVNFYETGLDPKDAVENLVDTLYRNHAKSVPIENALPYLIHIVRDMCKAHHKNNFPSLPPAKRIIFKKDQLQPLPAAECLKAVRKESVKTVTSVFGELFKDVDELVFGIGDGNVWWDDLKKPQKQLLREITKQDWSNGHLSRPYINKMVDNISGYEIEKDWLRKEEKIIEYIQLAKRV